MCLPRLHSSPRCDRIWGNVTTTRLSPPGGLHHVTQPQVPEAQPGLEGHFGDHLIGGRRRCQASKTTRSDGERSGKEEQDTSPGTKGGRTGKSGSRSEVRKRTTEGAQVQTRGTAPQDAPPRVRTGWQPTAAWGPWLKPRRSHNGPAPLRAADALRLYGVGAFSAYKGRKQGQYLMQ